MGRPLAFDKDQAVAEAMEVFWLNGYEGTSLQDLLAAMALSKSSFYQSFHSKHALFLRTINRYREQVTHEMRDSLAAAPSGRHFVEAVFSEFTDGLSARDREGGCFVLNCAGEFAQRDAEVAELVKGGMAQFEDVFRQALERAQSEGDLPASKDAQALAWYLVSSRSGLKTMAKAGASRDTLQDVVTAVFSTLGW